MVRDGIFSRKWPFSSKVVHRPTRERGRPARPILAKPHPSSPPGSTGSGAPALLRPGPFRSRRQGGGCRIAGKLSGRQRECMRAGRPRSRVAPPPIALAPQGGMRRLAGLQLCLWGRAVAHGSPSSSFVFLRGSFFFPCVSGRASPPPPSLRYDGGGSVGSH